MKRLYIYIICLLTACTKPSPEVELFDSSKFLMEIPSNWSMYTEDGIDSKITGLITESSDTIYFYYGKNLDGFTETVKVHAVESKAHFDSINWPYVDEMIFSKNATIDERQGVFLKEYYRYDTISGRKGKIMLPKVIGKGSTGIYFDSINSNGEQLIIYSENMDSISQNELYKAFYTIKFK